MRRVILSAAVFLFSVPAFAGLEQAVSAVGATFQQALEAPAGTLVPVFKRAAALDDEDSLIALLSDRDASVRAAAAKSLKNYALNSWKSENALLERAQDARELESVRREAIKSLAYAAQHWTTRDTLMRIAADEHETLSLRAITLKSLYVAAGVNDDQVKRSLADELSPNEPLALREAAAWALFGSANADMQVREQLLKLGQDGDEDPSMRIEALKSLYAAMGDWNLRDAVMRQAQDADVPVAIRETSILLLNAINQDWNVKDFLQKEASDESNGTLRAAAIKALALGPDMDLVTYFHLSYYQGRFVDPLESQ